MTALPGRRRLLRVLPSLCERLPEQLVGLLDASRFEQERLALSRLVEPEHASAAVAAMTDDEAGWLADLLLERWAAIGEPYLEATAVLLAPVEVWIGSNALECEVSVAVEGLEEGWIANWSSESLLRSSDTVAVLRLEPPTEALGAVSIRVKVEGRTSGRRTLLVDTATISLRNPRAIVSDDRTQVLVRDQADRPGAHVSVSIGDESHTSNGHGVVVLPAPASPGTRIVIGGADAGRVPPSHPERPEDQEDRHARSSND